jgi:hypothetical protein
LKPSKGIFFLNGGIMLFMTHIRRQITMTCYKCDDTLDRCQTVSDCDTAV